MNVKELIRAYAKAHRFTSLADSTKVNYFAALDDIEETLGHMDTNLVRRRDIIQAQETFSDRPAVANRFARTVSILFNYAADMDHCDTSPAQRLPQYKIGTWKKWGLEDIQNTIAINHPIVSTAVAIGYYTAQREGDVLNMRWDDIKDGHIHVTQRKTGKVMQIKLSTRLETILNEMPRGGVYIVGNQDKPLNEQSFRNMVKRETRKIGVDFPFHGIRKTVGSELAEKGHNINVIAAVLGHETLTMAALYTKQADSTKLITSAVNALAAD